MVDDDVVAYYDENGQLAGFKSEARELVLPHFLQLIKEVKGV